MIQTEKSFDDKEKINIVSEAIKSWADERCEKIDSFVDQNYSFSGAWRINKKAFGRDMLRAPANVVWSIPFLVIKGLGYSAGKIGGKPGERIRNKIAKLFAQRYHFFGSQRLP